MSNFNWFKCSGTWWLALMLFAQLGQAQSETRKLKKLTKAADKNLAGGNIYAASDQYEQILAKDSSNYKLQYNLGLAYFYARDYQAALKSFKSVATKASAEYPEALYYQAMMEKMTGDYVAAKAHFLQFNKTFKSQDPEKLKFKKWAKTEADGCTIAGSDEGKDDNLDFRHLDRQVNSNYTDLSPALIGDTALLLSSIRSDTILVIKPGEDPGLYLMKLFSSTKSGNEYREVRRIKTFDIEGKHIANPSVSADDQSLCYTLCEEINKKLVCRIYVAENDNGNWTLGEDAGKEVNLENFTATHPHLSTLKNGQQILFFASDRPGGRGGLDLWYAMRKKTGEFLTPRNAGFKINTDRDEATPFYDAGNGLLYFSSNGWITAGGYDVFRCPGEPNKFNSIENLGAPFNSSCDDMYYRHSGNGAQGYVVSNRPGIFSVKGPTCCDDIFEFTYKKVIHLAVQGYAYAETDPVKVRLEGAAFQLFQKTGGEEVKIGTDTSRGSDFFFTLKPGKEYRISASADGYFTGSAGFNSPGSETSDTIYLSIPLKKLEKNKAYRLNNIYYDFDKWDLRPGSEQMLDTLFTIMQENPAIIIELSSHTDSRGSDAYNQNLSQKRAESCVAYLINKKGLDSRRITAKGYGETKPLNDCTGKPECPQDNEGDCDCHQMNRRTEFKIVGELDGILLNEE